MQNKRYQILLYYKYVPIENHTAFAAEHLQTCLDLGLKGRIIVAHEGINGTVSGTVESTNRYMELMHSDSRFADMIFKVDPSDRHAFRKMFVRPKAEIVN